MKVGDWVQAGCELTEFQDTRTESLVSLKGGVGHVRGMFLDSAMVWFEATGVTSEVDVLDLKFLCESVDQPSGWHRPEVNE